MTRYITVIWLFAWLLSINKPIYRASCHWIRCLWLGLPKLVLSINEVICHIITWKNVIIVFILLHIFIFLDIVTHTADQWSKRGFSSKNEAKEAPIKKVDQILCNLDKGEKYCREPLTQRHQDFLANSIITKLGYW